MSERRAPAISGASNPFVPWTAHESLILASRSSRRAELLRTAGIPFEVVVAGEAEAVAAARNGGLRGEPGAYSRTLAEAKAAAVAGQHPDRVVLGADTVVVLDGELLEKPADADEAVAILRRLAGRTHTVITAIALLRREPPWRWIAAEATRVTFLPIDEASLRRYAATGEPLDKAGAYGIQGRGALMVERVVGCYFNVMGLPLARLGAGLRALAEAKPRDPGS